MHENKICIVTDKQRLRHANDKLLLEILKIPQTALPVNFLARLSGLSKSRVCRVLQSLERFGCVKKTTVAQAAFYKAAGD